jgi:tetratricopeptide (TPR) repeat protein
VYFHKGELDKALADYEKALEFDPQYVPALCGRGIVKATRADLAASGADLAQAQHFQPDIADVMRRAGVREK